MKQTTESLALRFDRIVNENLPKRLEMFKVLMEKPHSSKLFSTHGVGLKTILTHLGRIQDFKGIYAFIKDGRPVYIDESAYAANRVLRHYKGTTKYQLKLAHLILEAKQETDPNYSLKEAKTELSRFDVLFLDLPDDLERQITTIYLQCQFDCVYNRYD